MPDRHSQWCGAQVLRLNTPRVAVFQFRALCSVGWRTIVSSPDAMNRAVLLLYVSVTSRFHTLPIAQYFPVLIFATRAIHRHHGFRVGLQRERPQWRLRLALPIKSGLKVNYYFSDSLNPLSDTATHTLGGTKCQ